MRNSDRRNARNAHIGQRPWKGPFDERIPHNQKLGARSQCTPSLAGESDLVAARYPSADENIQALGPESERQKIVTLLRKSDKPENRIARDGRRVDRILAETRANGYGTRDPSFIGGAYGRQAPDGLAGI